MSELRARAPSDYVCPMSSTEPIAQIAQPGVIEAGAGEGMWFLGTHVTVKLDEL